MNVRSIARWIGALAVLLVVLAPFSMMYLPTLVMVPGDASATAQKVLAAESLYRLGILCDLTVCLIEVALIALLYSLFNPVNPLLTLMATLARLAMAVVQGVNVMNSIGVLVVLTGAAALPAFTAAQHDALAMILLKLHEQVVHIWEVFFALHCVLLGSLIARCGFVPKGFGPLMAVAGVGYLANGVGNLLFPQQKETLATIVALTAICGELPFFLWLLFKAVDETGWKRLAKT